MRIVGLFFLPVILLTACLEELEDIDKAQVGTLNPDVAIPLVSSNFTMQEFLQEGNSAAQVTSENGTILLIYADTVISQNASDLFQVDDQTSPDVVIDGAALSAIPPGGTATFNQSVTFNLTSGSDQLDSISLSAGDLITGLTINAPVSGSLALTFTSLERNGQPITQTINWTFDGTNSSQQLSDTEDLAGTSLILTDGSGSTNEISFEAEITVTNDGGAASSDEIRMSIAMNNLVFRGVFGDIVERDIQTPQKSEQIDIFNNIDDGTFQLDNPRIALTFENSFGLSAALSIANLSAQAKSGAIIMLSGDVITNQNPVTLDAPDFSEIGQAKTTTLTVNSQNSNLEDMLNSLPSEIIYSFPGRIDPNNEPNNFILSDSEINIFVDIELPLSGTISNLTLNKTFDFDGKGISELNEAVLIVNTINTFPLDARLQVYFLDDASNRLDSLYDDNFGMLMNAAQVDSQGFSAIPGEVNDRVVLDMGEIDRIDQATQLVMRVVLQTTNNGSVPVKVSPDNSLQVNLGIESELELDL